jgi:small subunit ribosomal protein S20
VWLLRPAGIAREIRESREYCVAHSLSAKKRMRQNFKRNQANRARRSRLKRVLKETYDAVAAKGAAAVEAVKDAVSLVDREATRGLLHKNAAARRKSRLARRVNAAGKTGTTAKAGK